jgi:His-Xaa-Ser system radical SAM maturase HxsB
MENYLLNNYRKKKIGNEFLITTDQGSWTFLNESDFKVLNDENFKENQSLFNLLEEKGIIITEKNREKIVNSLRKRCNFLFGGTSLHIVIPTLRCNQKCVYCHASSKGLWEKGYDMDEETAKKTVDFIFQSPSKFITIEFQGGEPLLNFDIIKFIIEYAEKLNETYKKELLFTVVTNSILLDDEKMDYLINKEVGICTSLDGPKKLHDANRPFAKNISSHEFVEKRIERVLEEYKKKDIENRRVHALITITKESLKYPKEIVDEYIRVGLKDIHLRFLNNLGDARQLWGKVSYPPEEFIEFWEKALDYILELNKKGVLFKEHACVVILQKILQDFDPNFLDIRSPCGAAIGQLAYDPSGNIFTCDEARMVGEDLFKIGNVKSDNYKEVLTSNSVCVITSSSINDCHICDSCVYKPYCGVCPVCNFVEQGSIIAKIPETARCKVYKFQFTYVFNKIKDPENRKIFLDWLKLDGPKDEKGE